jgi:hypothetical protein
MASQQLPEKCPGDVVRIACSRKGAGNMTGAAILELVDAAPAKLNSVRHR